jgi:hypothetical protein
MASPNQASSIESFNAIMVRVVVTILAAVAILLLLDWMRQPTGLAARSALTQASFTTSASARN